MKQSFHQWVKHSITKTNSFGDMAIAILEDHYFPANETEYEALEYHVREYLLVDHKIVPFPTEVFDRMYIAYAIEWFEDFTKPLKRHRDRADGKNQDY